MGDEITVTIKLADKQPAKDLLAVVRAIINEDCIGDKMDELISVYNAVVSDDDNFDLVEVC